MTIFQRKWAKNGSGIHKKFKRKIKTHIDEIKNIYYSRGGFALREDQCDETNVETTRNSGQKGITEWRWKIWKNL